MTRRLTQEMRFKIVVWLEAFGSARQTQGTFNREFSFFFPELRNNASVENCFFRLDKAPDIMPEMSEIT